MTRYGVSQMPLSPVRIRYLHFGVDLITFPGTIGIHSMECHIDRRQLTCIFRSSRGYFLLDNIQQCLLKTINILARGIKMRFLWHSMEIPGWPRVIMMPSLSLLKLTSTFGENLEKQNTLP